MAHCEVVQVAVEGVLDTGDHCGMFSCAQVKYGGKQNSQGKEVRGNKHITLSSLLGDFLLVSVIIPLLVCLYLVQPDKQKSHFFSSN